MDHSVIAGHGHGDACLLQPWAILLGLNAHSIVLGGDNQCRGQSTQGWSQKWGRIRMLDLLRTVQIMLGEPGMILFGYVAVLTCIGFDSRCLPPDIGIGIANPLADQCRTSSIT